MNYYEIGQRIRRIRKAHNLSQEELAEKVNISVTHMSHIETGNTKLSLPVLVAIAGTLAVRTDDLLFEASPATSSAALEDIARVLESCTAGQAQCIADIVRAAKRSFDQNL